MKPILFNTEMVKAILDGRKTTTRRLVKPQPLFIELSGRWVWSIPKSKVHKGCCTEVCSASREWWNYLMPDQSLYQVGDILYVRETWLKADDGFHYKADIKVPSESEDLRNAYGYKWHPSLHMTKEAARIFLRVKEIRTERLQCLNNEDAIKEGLKLPCHREHDDCSAYTHCLTGYKDGKGSCIQKFINLWDSTIPKENHTDMYTYGWNNNPWIWVIEFERIGKEEAESITDLN